MLWTFVRRAVEDTRERMLVTDVWHLHASEVARLAASWERTERVLVVSRGVEKPGSAGPVDLGPTRRAFAISAGTFGACTALDNGEVRCWGRNDWGQLGLGHTEIVGDDESPGSTGPVDHDVTSVPSLAPVTTTTNTALFRNVPTGRYVFHVTASNAVRTGPPSATSPVNT